MVRVLDTKITEQFYIKKLAVTTSFFIDAFN